MEIISGTIAAPLGFYADGQHCGLKKEKKDIGWFYSEVPAAVAGVFTTNKVQAAPIKWDKEIVKNGKVQAVVVNSGNANACTGPAGHVAVKKMAEKVAEKLAIPTEFVAVSSTGIIGQPMPLVTLETGINSLAKDGNAYHFHEAILTTDTVTKEIVVTEEIAGEKIILAGVAKGSGMIHPNMATMLGYVTTDANISAELLQEILKELTEVTFNQITVDGDTSTNDTVLVIANGLAQTKPILKDSEAFAMFKADLHFVLETLAKKIAQDGEGATKLIEVEVTEAKDPLAARMVAKSIVGSDLLKSAVFGKDPNWGRILCAGGYAGVDFDFEKVAIALAGIPVFEAGMAVQFDEELMAEKLADTVVPISMSLAEGQASGKAWGCDLTYDYVKINALYST
ncbi:bifunctional glutamate N-acetyltransferase/amino-acid acetyltransferase ArgJ [Enterococcus sp. LJL120]